MGVDDPLARIIAAKLTVVRAGYRYLILNTGLSPGNGSVTSILDGQLRPLVSFRTPHVTFPANTDSSRHIVQ